MNFYYAVLLGTIEGLTEFLPISSTAHLMLTAEFAGLNHQDPFLKTFEIAIQPGAILAVVVLYWRKLLIDWAIFHRVAIAFVPTAAAGLVLYPIVKANFLENIELALAALALGGVALIAFERFHGKDREEIQEIAQLSYGKCILIGCFQSVALVPGVSRSAATILGGMIVGGSRKNAVEFSFLLAVPTMLAATGKDLIESQTAMGVRELQLLGVGFLVSFVVAIVSIQFLLRYIRTHSFVPFGIYRIVFAAVVALVLFAR